MGGIENIKTQCGKKRLYISGLERLKQIEIQTPFKKKLTSLTTQK